MQTRKTVDLSKKDIKELLLPTTPKKSTRRLKRERIEQQVDPQPQNVILQIDDSHQTHQLLQQQDAIIQQQQLVINTLTNKIEAARTLASISFPTIIMIIDTESFKIMIPNKSIHPILLPIQIACNVYMWDTTVNRLIEISTFNAYIYETLSISDIDTFIKGNGLKKHKENMEINNVELMSADFVIRYIQDLIEKYSVSTVVGYNISWDFMSIKNMIAFLCTQYDNQFYDAACDNPFNPADLTYIDLMHEVVKKYGEQLTHQGLHDGTIHYASSNSNKLQLKKNYRSIYCAQYVLFHFFGVEQEHLAQKDVHHEALLLEKILGEFGLHKIEMNICYPQESCYQRMLKLATHAVKSNEVVENGDACMFDDDLDDIDDIDEL